MGMMHRCQSSKLSSVSVYERCMALYSSKSKDTTINIKHRHFTKSRYIQYNDNDDVTREASARRIRRRYGRIRRKRKLKQQLNSTNEDEIDTTINKKRENEDDVSQSSDNQPINDTKTIPKEAQLTGNLLRDRYILSQRPIKYPKTLKGWKDIFNTVWDKYLWTFEGFLLEEKSNRDKHGNILPKEETDHDNNDSNEKNKSLQDKATDAANEVASNVQKNISTMKEEAPKLVQLGQQITGVTTKEELREWVGEQLKLGTACLAEFMKGYRKGRDDEVDRMLHQYFKDEEKSQADGGNDDKVSTDNSSNDAEGTQQRKRPWGRRERRRQKQSNTSKSAASSEVVSFRY